MPTLSSLRSKKAVIGATVLAPTPGAQPLAAQVLKTSRCSYIQPPPAAGAVKGSLSASSSRPKAPASAAAPKPAASGASASPPLTRGVSLLRKAPRSKLSQVTGARTSPEEEDEANASTSAARSSAAAAAPAPAAPAASTTRSGIPTSSRPASVASTGPASRPSSSIASRRTSRVNSPAVEPVVHVEASASSPESPSAASRAEPPADTLNNDDSAASTPTPLARSSSLSPAVIGPIQSAASSRLRRSIGGAASGSADGSPAARSPPRRAALAESKTNNGTVVVVQKSRAASASPQKQAIGGKIAAASAPKRPAAALATAEVGARPLTTHRRSLSTSQARSPPVTRLPASSTTMAAVRPRPRPISMIAPPGGGIASSLPARTTSPSTSVVKPRLVSAIPLSPKPSVLRAPSGQATPTRLGHDKGLGAAGRTAFSGVEVVVTPSRGAEDSLGLPPRSSLSYPSPQPQPLDTLSPPMIKKPLPKSPLNRLSTAGRLVPRSSLVSFEVMSRTLLPAEDSLLVEEADASEFGVALSGVVSPPSSISSRTSRKRREAAVSSDGSDAAAAKDPFGSLSASSTTHSFIPLPVAAAPQTPDVSHAALQSRLQQSLLAQAALQRELETERARAHAAADADALDLTADLTIELDAAKLQVETLESREEATREETAALEELLQASQDDLETAEARARALQATVDSLAAASDGLRQQASQLAEALEKADGRAGVLQAEGERAMVDRWAAVARRAREELAACQGERETLALVEGMAQWEAQAA